MRKPILSLNRFLKVLIAKSPITSKTAKLFLRTNQKFRSNRQMERPFQPNNYLAPNIKTKTDLVRDFSKLDLKV